MWQAALWRKRDSACWAASGSKYVSPRWTVCPLFQAPETSSLLVLFNISEIRRDGQARPPHHPVYFSFPAPSLHALHLERIKKQTALKFMYHRDLKALKSKKWGSQFWSRASSGFLSVMGWCPLHGPCQGRAQHLPSEQELFGDKGPGGHLVLGFCPFPAQWNGGWEESRKRKLQGGKVLFKLKDGVGTRINRCELYVCIWVRKLMQRVLGRWKILLRK